MTPDQFKDWVIRLREELTAAWDNNGCPPRTGNERGRYYCFLQSHVGVFLSISLSFDDELSETPKDVIINKSRLGV